MKKHTSTAGPADPFQVLAELERATNAAFALARALLANAEGAKAGDDEWTRLPTGGKGTRCKVSNWSRSTLIRMCDDPAIPIRGKRTRLGRFYSLADVRAYLTKQPDQQPAENLSKAFP